MTPKFHALGVDQPCMGFSFSTKQRSTALCKHTTEIKIEVAGLSRSVCESCGNVSVGFVKDIYPEDWIESDSDEPSEPED
jgi:hypothetical protein